MQSFENASIDTFEGGVIDPLTRYAFALAVDRVDSVVDLSVGTAKD